MRRRSYAFADVYRPPSGDEITMANFRILSHRKQQLLVDEQWACFHTKIVFLALVFLLRRRLTAHTTTRGEHVSQTTPLLCLHLRVFQVKTLLEVLVSKIEASSSKFCVGDSLTIADLQVR